MSSITINKYLLNHNQQSEFDETIFKQCVSCFLIYFFSLFIYGIIHFLEKNKEVYSKLVRIIEILRSILTGIIISLFITRQYSEIFYSNVVLFILSNLPLLLLISICILLSLSIFSVLRCKENVYEQFPENDFAQELSSQDNQLNVNPSIKDLKITDDLYTVYNSLLYLSLALSNAFFAGLGLKGWQCNGFFEMFVLIHRIVECFHLKQAFNRLRISERTEFYYILFFIFITPIGILFRCIYTIFDFGIDKLIMLQLFNNLFFQSFMIITLGETKALLSTAWPNIGINLVLTFASCFLFSINKLQFKK